MDASGKRRSSSRRIIRSPTAPLAPTTATCFTVAFSPELEPRQWMVAGRTGFASVVDETRNFYHTL